MNIHHTNSNGWTPLFNAAHQGHLAVVQYLIEKGFNINHTESSGINVLVRAAFMGHLHIAKYLVEEKGKLIDNLQSHELTALIYAARRGHLDVLSYLIEKRNVKVNDVDSKGKTALMSALFFSDIESVSYLLSTGALLTEEQKLTLSEYDLEIFLKATRSLRDKKSVRQVINVSTPSQSYTPINEDFEIDLDEELSL